jgi:hypothetical protein
MKNESWVCVDGHGNERIFPEKPNRSFPEMNLEVEWGQCWEVCCIDSKFKHGVILPKGTIKHLIGIEMSYKDEPIKL